VLLLYIITLHCFYYLNPGLTEEDQELVTLSPPSAYVSSSVQTSSVEFTGASSSLGQAGCSRSPSQENTGQMMPSRVLIASSVFVFYFSHSLKPCPMGLGAITHIVKVLLWEQ
jgi:hypothetical protein